MATKFSKYLYHNCLLASIPNIQINHTKLCLLAIFFGGGMSPTRGKIKLIKRHFIFHADKHFFLTDIFSHTIFPFTQFPLSGPINNHVAKSPPSAPWPQPYKSQLIAPKILSSHFSGSSIHFPFWEPFLLFS
jgi:hypothetical protein